MRCQVLKPFPCSFNGVTSDQLDTGDEMEFGDMAAGLIAEGLIKPMSARSEPAASKGATGPKKAA